MIQLINATTNAYLVFVEARPRPSGIAYERTYRRASKLYDERSGGDWGQYVIEWENEKRRPAARDCAELAWIKRNAKDATVVYDGLLHNQAMFVLTFATKAQSLMFKLSFGGDCEPLAFAA